MFTPCSLHVHRACFQRLRLKYHELLSKVAFKFNLRRHSKSSTPVLSTRWFIRQLKNLEWGQPLLDKAAAALVGHGADPFTSPSYPPHTPLIHLSYSPHTPLLHHSCTPHTPLIHHSYTTHTPFIHHSYPPHIPLSGPWLLGMNSRGVVAANRMEYYVSIAFLVVFVVVRNLGYGWSLVGLFRVGPGRLHAPIPSTAIHLGFQCESPKFRNSPIGPTSHLHGLLE